MLRYFLNHKQMTLGGFEIGLYFILVLRLVYKFIFYHNIRENIELQPPFVCRHTQSLCR